MPDLNRRTFLAQLGACSAAAQAGLGTLGAQPERPPLVPRAKRVIFLCMAGAPSQLDLFCPKPQLNAHSGKPMPGSLVSGQRVAQLRGQPLIAVGSRYRFARHGDTGNWFSELLPHMATCSDHFAAIHSMQTEAINHDPGITMLQTGFQLSGRPSFGAWLSYGLGAEAKDLPGFLVMVSGGVSGDQPLYTRLWGPGFLPGVHQGVKLQKGRDPVLFLRNPQLVSPAARRAQLDALARLNRETQAEYRDPEVETRIQSYELAHRMQSSIPELMDLGKESPETLALYGCDPQEPSFARNCLLARRMAERGVRFIQLFHRGWDHHENLPPRLELKCGQVDQATAALVHDLERRGLLDDTLLVWGGEFGRSPMNQGDQSNGTYGRDHHGRSFSLLVAGGGIRPGPYGTTDDFGYDVVDRPVHVHDLHATLLYGLGFDHEKLIFRHAGRDYRLTDVAGRVVTDLLA